MSANEFPDPIPNRVEPRGVFQQILVAVDESRQAGWATDLAIRLARAHDARLILLHVVFIPPLQPELGYIEPADRENCFLQAERLLERTEARVPAGVRVENVLREGEAANEICKAAELFGADLILMGTHGRSAIGRMILGSVANAVVRKAACPVLTVAHGPPNASEPARETSSACAVAT
jgi:nucleotide-binding universal stress UspA family protein